MATNIKGTINADTEHLGSLHVHEDLSVDGALSVTGEIAGATSGVLSDVVWDDQQGDILSAAGAAALTLGTWRDTGVPVVEFSGTQNDTLGIPFQMTHRWKKNSEVRVHAHLAATTAPASDKNARFLVSYAWSHVGAELPAAVGWTTPSPIDVPIPASGAKTHKQFIVPLCATTPTGSHESSFLLVKLTRQATDNADTYTDTIVLLGLDAHVQIEKAGTSSEIPS